MQRPRSLLAALLLALAFFAAPMAAEPHSSDSIPLFLQRVVDAVGQDEIPAFDPLRLPGAPFDWFTIKEVTSRYWCPRIDDWSFTVLERSDTDARVEVKVDARALQKGTGALAAFPSFWIARMRRWEGQWYLTSFLTLERDLAMRIVRECPEEWVALFGSVPEADPRALVHEIADTAAFNAVESYDEDHAAAVPSVLRFARDEAQLLGDRAGEAYVLSMQTTALRMYGKREEALAVAEEDVRLADEEGDPEVQIVAYFSRGLGRWVNGDVAGAQADLAVCERLHRFAGNTLKPLKALAMRAVIALDSHDYRAAIQFAERLKAHSREVAWDEGESFSLYVMGDIHYALRDFEAARELYSKAHAIAVRAHTDFVGLALIDMARCDLALGNPIRANEEMADSHAAAMDSVHYLSNLALTLMAESRFAEADRVLRKAVKRAGIEDDTQAVSDAFTALTQLRLKQGRLAEALAAAEKALDYGLHGKSPLFDWSAWRAEAAAARALQALGRSQEARTAMENAIILIEQLRTTMVSDPAASRYFEDKADLYADLMETDLTLGDVHGALTAAERLRARTLRDSLSQTTLDRNASLTPQERTREASAEKQLEAANRKVLASGNAPSAPLREERDRARSTLDRVTDELMAAHPDLRIRRADLRISLSLPSALDDTAIVEYAVAADATFIFTIVRDQGRTKIAVKRVKITRRKLVALVNRLTTQFSERDLNLRDAASRLYELLVAPVADTILAKQELCIIPDGALWSVPFQILIDKKGVDLISKRPLFYAPALTLLTTAPTPVPPAAGSRTLVAFANPRPDGDAIAHMRALFRGSNLGTLPDAETEVARIADIYGRDRSEVFIGDAARESTFKRAAQTARIVHIATHGVIDDHAPLYSALLFASGDPNGDDGLLEAREVLDLHLSADLVVLSACDTARGKIGAGEGVIGLSWAFLVAGCRTLVVAQSPAESRATSRLMVEFHRSLHRGLTPAAAMRDAQLTLRRNPRFANPFYWAPFVVIGQGFAPLRR